MITDDKLYEIAKIIDNEYNDTKDNFTVSRKAGHYYLHTDKCDHCLPIKVYSQDCIKIDNIERLCLDTEDWINLHPNTISEIDELKL